MCNENKEKKVETHDYDYRFFDYRLNKLEQEITKGLKKLEDENTQNSKELMKMLQLVQENNNEQNKTLVKLGQRQESMGEKLRCIDKLRDVATENRTRIKEVERRLEVYKQILFVVGTGVAIALIKAFIFNI
jgi:CHASE3 domain sensor protein